VTLAIERFDRDSMKVTDRDVLLNDPLQERIMVWANRATVIPVKNRNDQVATPTGRQGVIFYEQAEVN